MEWNTEKLKLARIVLKCRQTPLKRNLYTQQEKVSRFYQIFPYNLYIPIHPYNNAVMQCHVDGALRAWATCDPIKPIQS